MAFISSARASCAISGIDLLAAGPYSSVSPSLSLSSSLLSLSFKLLFFPSLSLYLSPSLARFVSRRFFFFFFFWPGRPSQCEIMVNAPWQSDTTHSPGPAPSGFNLIWSEKKKGGGMMVLVVKGCRVRGGERWRDGGLGACGVGMGGWGDKMKACCVILRRNRLTILHSSQIALSPPHMQQ